MNNQLSWFKQFHYFGLSSWFFFQKMLTNCVLSYHNLSNWPFPITFQNRVDSINKSDYFRLAKQTEFRFLTLPDYVRRSKCGEWRWKLCEEKTTSLKWDWAKEDLTAKHLNRQWKLGNYFFFLALFFLSTRFKVRYFVLCSSNACWKF